MSASASLATETGLLGQIHSVLASPDDMSDSSEVAKVHEPMQASQTAEHVLPAFAVWFLYGHEILPGGECRPAAVRLG